MSHFLVLRRRILTAIALTSVAQACGGTVDNSALEDETDPSADGPGGCEPSTTSQPPLDPDHVFGAPESSAACGGIPGGSCSPLTRLECFQPSQLDALLLSCAAPVEPGTCPPVVDLDREKQPCIVDSDTPTLNDGTCCYSAVQYSCAVPGRPLRVAGTVRLPAVVETPDRPVFRDEDGTLDQATRAALANAWCDDGRYEHASVASFARLTLQLLSLGAPRELIAESQAASLDEVEHARLCFSLASRFAERGLGPGTLAVDDARVDVDLTELAVDTVIDACIGETIAAAMVAEQRRTAGDEEVRAALERIGDDEVRHAELGWRIVAWALEAGGDRVRKHVIAAFRRELALPPKPSTPTPRVDPAAWRANGRLSAERRDAVYAEALRTIVEPCARALLGAAAASVAPEAREQSFNAIL